MTQKHTPGPWKVDQWQNTSYADGFEYVVTDSRGRGIVELCHKGKNKKALANARLIAQAPALLAERDRLREEKRELVRMLKDISENAQLGKVACRGVDRVKSYEITPEMLGHILYAIAKAEKEEKK